MSTGTTAVKPLSLNKIDGVNLSVEVDGVRILPWERDKWYRDEDGFIPRLTSAKEVLIGVRIDPGINVFGFNVDGNKNITPAKNYSQVGRVYRKKVPIHIPIHKDKELYTLYNENHLKLLEIGNGKGCYFAVWEVAVVFQNGLGFLTKQRVYEDFAYWDGNRNKVSCPTFNEKWPQLVRFIENTCEGIGFSYTDFPYIDEYASDLEKSMDAEDDGIGMMKWYNLAQGFGAISTNKGDAFVHHKDIDSPERLISLGKGDMVLFEKLILNTSGEGFPYKAVGVLAPEA